MSGRRLRWLPGVALAVYAAATLLGGVEEQWRPEWDSAIYLLAARSLADGTGYTYLGKPFFLRPPGFSWALSFLVRDGGFDFAQVNALMMASAVAAVAAVYLALRTTEGPTRALAATVLLATCPLFVARFNWIDSDLPFLALYFAAIFLFERATRGARGAVAACVGGSLLLTAAIYVRTVGFVLLPGVVLLFLFRRRGRQRLLGLVPALLVPLLVAPWLHYTRDAAAVAQRPSEQLMLFDYATATFHVDPGDPDSATLSAGEWLERIQTNIAHVVSDLAAYVLGARSGWTSALMVALLILGFVAAVIRGPTLLEWHVLTMVAFLLIKMLAIEPKTYFSHEARLLVPLLPAIYAYVVSVLDQMRRRLGLGAGSVSAALAFSGLLLANLTALPAALNPRAMRLPVGTVGDTWDDYPSAAQWLRENTTDGAVIMAEMAPIVSLLAERRVYTNRFPRAPEMLRRYGIDYVVTFWWSASSFEGDVAASAEQRWVLPSHTDGKTMRIYKMAKG